MKNLRSLHLYLGCVFAPMLLFFAVSGIWQMTGIHSSLLSRLSTIHTSHALKAGGTLTNVGLKAFVLVMALSFILTTVLGVMMAVKYGRSKTAVYASLALGVVIPLGLIAFSLFK